MMLTFFPGVLMVLSANLVATRDRRADSDELLAPLPGRAEERFLAPRWPRWRRRRPGSPALALHACYLADDRYVVAPTRLAPAGRTGDLVGACLFGIMLGSGCRFAPRPSSASSRWWWRTSGWTTTAGYRLFGAATPGRRWGLYGRPVGRSVPGSAACTSATSCPCARWPLAAAWVRVGDRRTPAVVLGLVALGTAVACGIAQLP